MIEIRAIAFVLEKELCVIFVLVSLQSYSQGASLPLPLIDAAQRLICRVFDPKEDL
jgi:hypothetical protein